MSIENINVSITGLGRGVQAAQGSAMSISSTLKQSLKFKRESIRISQDTFVKRREAVRRREKEDLIEAGTITGAASRMQNIAAKSTKGFMGRIMDFLGALLVSWAVKNLPIIIKTITELINRIRKFANVLSNFITNTTNFFTSLGGIVTAAAQNILKLDFTDGDKRIRTAVTEMDNSFKLMQGNIDAAFEILTEPIDYSDLDKAANNAFSDMTEPESEEESAGDTSGSGTTPGAGPSSGPTSYTTYSSQGGTKITDVGGQDYGYYRPGAVGSRGSARVHGAGGQRGHTGEDYAMPIGKPLTMIAKGTVVDIQTTVAGSGGYGKFVVVKLDSGMYVKMAHLDKVYVKKGDRVGAGSAGGGRAVVIGTSGNTGLSLGPHLHLDYAREYNPANAAVSQTANPKSFIEGGGLVIGSNVKSTGQVTTTSTSGSSASQSSSSSGSSSGSSSSGSVGTKEQRAMLDAIAFAEGTAKYPNNGYNTHFAGSQFSDLSRHPDKVIRSGRYASAAAGRYQFMPDTFNEIARRLGLKDFSPASQDKAAIELARTLGVTQEFLVREGMSFNTSAALGRQWASFPGKSIGLDQPTKKLSGIQKVYQQSLGSGGSQANVASSISVPNLQSPAKNNNINVPMPSGQQQTSGGSSGGGILDTLSNAGDALNRFITQRFLNNL